MAKTKSITDVCLHKRLKSTRKRKHIHGCNVVFFKGHVDKPYKEIWNNFISLHPDGNIFQTTYYADLFSNQNRFLPVFVLLFDDNNQIKGVLSGIIQYQFHNFLKYLTSRCIIIGGPLVINNDQKLTREILTAFDEFIRKKVIYTQIRNLINQRENTTIFTELKYQDVSHLNIIVDLSADEETLWTNIHKQKRYEIRRAIKEGIIIEPISDYSDLQKSYNILKSVYNRIKLPIFPFNVFQNAFDQLRNLNMACFFGAYLNGKLIGTMYTLCYKGRIFDFFSGFDHSYKKYYPNSLIPWSVFLWGKKNKMSIFDWGGAGKPDQHYGVRDYKSKYGGSMDNYGRFIKINNNFLYFLAQNTFLTWRKIRKSFSIFHETDN